MAKTPRKRFDTGSEIKDYYKYKWDDFEAYLRFKPSWKEWSWVVDSVQTGESLFSGYASNTELKDAKGAEDEMMFQISERIGITPKSQVGIYSDGGMMDDGKFEGMHADIYRSDYDSPTNKLYGKKGVTIVDSNVPKIFEANSKYPAVRLVRRKLSFGEYIHAVPIGIEDGRSMMGGTFIYSSDSRFPSKYPIPLHDRVESQEYADGGELSDEEFIQEAVNFMNYNGYADIVSDGKGGWLVSYLNEDEDYIDVEYDSQGVVYLALEKGFNEDGEFNEDEDEDEYLDSMTLTQMQHDEAQLRREQGFAKGGVTSKAEDLKKVIGKETSENGSPTLRAKLIKVGRSNSIFESVKSPYVKNVDAKKIGLKYSVPNYIAWNAFFFGNGGQFDFKPYGKTKGRYKIEYVEEGKKQSEVWESKEMVEDRGKKLLKLGCTNIKITEVEKMARGGEPKPSLIPDYKKISGVEVEDIDMADYPDFSDAYISYAEYDGEPMTDEQLEELNQDGYFVYDAIQRRLFAKGGRVKVTKASVISELQKLGFGKEKAENLLEEHIDIYEINEDDEDAKTIAMQIDEQYNQYARGGKVKRKNWIQEALSGNKGELRKTAKRKGLIKGDEKLSKSDLRKLKKMGGKTAKRARLAETLIEFKK
jgi:hypothetical protein